MHYFHGSSSLLVAIRTRKMAAFLADMLPSHEYLHKRSLSLTLTHLHTLSQPLYARNFVFYQQIFSHHNHSICLLSLIFFLSLFSIHFHAHLSLSLSFTFCLFNLEARILSSIEWNLEIITFYMHAALQF